MTFQQDIQRLIDGFFIDLGDGRDCAKFFDPEGDDTPIEWRTRGDIIFPLRDTNVYFPITNSKYFLAII